MSTPNERNEDRVEETKQVRVTREETYSSIEPDGSASRRKLVVIVAAVALFAMVILLLAFLWLRPAKEVTTEAPAAAYPGQDFRGSLVDIGAVIDERTLSATILQRC